MDPAVRTLLEALRDALDAKVEPARMLAALDYVLDHDGYLSHATEDLRELAEQARHRDKEDVA
jgi:uncharacterized membrane protein